MYFKRKITKSGNSLCINVPKDLADFMEFEDDVPIIISVESDQNGNYMMVRKGAEDVTQQL